MAGYRAKLDLSKWRDKLRKIKSHSKNAAPALKTAYATIGFADIIRHFNRGVNEDGRRWAPLEESTKRRRKQTSPKILRDTGNLRNSFSPANAKRINRQAILIFNNADYSGIHQEGSERRNLPARQFMYLTERALKKMIKYIVERINRP